MLEKTSVLEKNHCTDPRTVFDSKLNCDVCCSYTIHSEKGVQTGIRTLQMRELETSETYGTEKRRKLIVVQRLNIKLFTQPYGRPPEVNCLFRKTFVTQ